jgi:hypothetical protein
MGVGGVFCRGLAQRHVRTSATFFVVPTRGGLFSCPFSLFAAFFLSFFLGAVSLSLSSALSRPRPPRVAMSQRWADKVRTTYTNVT